VKCAKLRGIRSTAWILTIGMVRTHLNMGQGYHLNLQLNFPRHRDGALTTDSYPAAIFLGVCLEANYLNWTHHVNCLLW
jgi:hypothetical protein